MPFKQGKFAPSVLSSTKTGSLFENTNSNVTEEVILQRKIVEDKPSDLFLKKVDFTPSRVPKRMSFKQKAQQAFKIDKPHHTLFSEATLLQSSSATNKVFPDNSFVREKTTMNSSLKKQFTS